MTFPEEPMAYELHRELVRRFESLSPVVSGAGVHWKCTVGRGDRECQVSCHSLPQDREYYTSFRQRAHTVAYSRTQSSAETLDAVADWLDGADLVALYERFSFIDARKRALERIRDEVIQLEPELEHSTTPELEQQIADIYRLIFRGAQRACGVSFYGENEWPDARFSWQECQLFQYQPHSNAQFASVLKAWLCDTLQPSKMRSQFPWLTIGELADYYETGNPVEGEFVQSWNNMEKFYDNTRIPFAADVKALIKAMRSNGYDKTLRAGQSMWSLIVSRSRRHGMRSDQPCIQFWFHDEGMNVFNFLEDRQQGTKIECTQILMTPEIDTLIGQLQLVPID